jgi:hypothetical protein
VTKKGGQLQRMEGAGARKRRRIDDADQKKEFRQKMKENSQFQEKERLRHIEKRKMKKVEYQLPRLELENERLAHEKLKKKYKKTKDQLCAVETHVEFLEGAFLSSKETRISATVSETFLAKVKLNEKTFYSFFGMTIALFESLLLSVTPIYNDTTMKGKKRIWKKETTKLIVETMLLMTLFWLQIYPHKDLLSILFNIHPQSAIKYLHMMIVSLRKVLEKEIAWPTKEEWVYHLETFNKWLPPTLKGCISVVDGTEIQIL